MNDSNKNLAAPDNFMRLQFASRSENEAFARVAVGAFVAQLDPTMEQLTELKTAVSEAVTNAIIHGYDGTSGEVRITCALWPGMVEITVEDDGCGIEDIEQAMQPLYTTKPELERSGMGLTIMENFVDELYIDSSPQHGTRVRMRKSLASVPQGQ